MKLKLPSLQTIIQKSSDALTRFPFVLITAMVGVISTVILIEKSQYGEFDDYYLVNLSMVAALGISLFIAAKMYAESQNWSLSKALGLNAFIALLLVAYFITLPEGFTERESEPLYRYFLFMLFAHLLVSVAPFLNRTEEETFWAYNKTLFLRILTSGFYSFALFVGLAIALISIENLLDVNLDGETYGQLFVIIVGLFNTWFFLSGVPHPRNITDEEREYPGGLKVFVQYILIPLITVYIVILYLYMAKIIVDWQWPNGWVANLVLVFSIAGILALLLLHPIRNKSENRWMILFSKEYYIGLIPLIILLMLSIWVRISEYGITVNRYFVATLAVWLTGIVFYNLISSSKNIKVIPASLGIIVILISFGPLGAFEVTERSQLGRFEQLLANNQMLENGKVVEATSGEIPFDDRKQMSSILKYMMEQNGVEPLQPYFDENLNEVIEKDSTDRVYNQVRLLTDLLGFEYVSEYQTEEGFDVEKGHFTVSLKENTAIPVTGYSHLLGEFSFLKFEKNKTAYLNGDTLQIHFDSTMNAIEINSNVFGDTTQVPLEKVLKHLKALSEDSGTSSFQPGLDEMTVTAEGGSARYKLVFQHLNWMEKEEEITIINMRFVLFVDEME